MTFTLSEPFQTLINNIEDYNNVCINWVVTLS